MTVSQPPEATLSLLHRADGSATYVQNGYCVTGGVNGPVEVQRRDELPEEAAIDVVVRPAVGIGTLRERHLESIIESTLRHIVLVQNHPRTLIQVTLQVTNTPDDEDGGQTVSQNSSNLRLLPALLQTSILALLSASIPLAMTLASTVISVGPSGELIPNPTSREYSQSSSTHVLSFSSFGNPLVIESEGDFTIDTWEQVFMAAKRLCLEEKDSEGFTMMDTGVTTMQDYTRTIVQGKVTQAQQWKHDV